MTDPTDSRPLDLSDLREAEALGRAWDAWLRDDIEPTRHQVSRSLAAGIAATVEELYDWDDTPAAPASFRLSLKRDLLHMHDALRATPPASDGDAWPSFPATGQLHSPPLTSPPTVVKGPARVRRWRTMRRWWPALEFAAAAIILLGLFGVTFGNARIAEFFRDDKSGNFASQGEPVSTTIQVDPNAPIAIEQGWISAIRDDAGVGLRPEHITVSEGYVAVVSDHYESGAIFLSVFDAEGGERLWTASVNTGIHMGMQGQDSAPIIAGGRLYFLNRAGFFYGFDIAAYPGPGGLLASVQFPFSGTMGDLVLHDRVLYAVGGETDEADWNLPSMVEFGGSLYIAGDADDTIVGYDIASNVFLAQAEDLPIDKSVTLGAGSGSSTLWQMDLATGTVTSTWQETDISFQYVSALDSGVVAVSLTTADGLPIGISFRDGKNIETEIYRYLPTDSMWDPRAFPAASVAIVMTSPSGMPQELVAIDPLRPDAQVELPWDYRNAPTKPDPIIGGTTSIVISDDDVLRVFDPLSGAILGQAPIGHQDGEVTTLTVVDDVVYAAFENGTVVEFLLVETETPATSPAPAAAPTSTLSPA